MGVVVSFEAGDGVVEIREADGRLGCSVGDWEVCLGMGLGFGEK